MNKLNLYFHLLRYWQWIKNIILLIPLLLTDIANFNLLIDNIILFFLFSFFVSSTYILNDIKDYKEDKKHPKKSRRPIASGDVTITESLALFSLLFLLSLTITYYYFGNEVFILFLFYLSLTILYSLKLKYIGLIDGIIVSFLYVNRLYIGSKFSKITLSFELTSYIFLLSMLIFYLKKNSILNIKNYRNKLKVAITYQNTLLPISKIIDFLTVSLNIVLTLWLFKFISTPIDFIFGLVFLVSHFSLLKELITLSNNGSLEDISMSIFEARKIKSKVLLTIIFFVLFYYL